MRATRSIEMAGKITAEQEGQRSERIARTEQQRAASKSKYAAGELVEVHRADGTIITGSVKSCTEKFWGVLVAVRRDDGEGVLLVVADRVKKQAKKRRARGPAF